jgi:superfamily II DNA or RNA helicase
MAGLLLKELKIRGLVERTLIVTPANLTDQWRREMKERFGDVFQVVRGGTLEDLYGRNVWVDTAQCITSMDFAKPSRRPERQHVFEALKEGHWDLVIVDEAHKMAAYQRGEERGPDKSDRYKLGEALSERCDHFLMLTATPHKGDPENFRLLLQLLDKEMFESPRSLEVALQNREAPLFLRRLKEDMVDFPKPGETKAPRLFRDRHVKTVTFRLKDSASEWHLYEEVTRYVEDQSVRAAAAGKRGRLIGLTLALLQRRLASSIRAIRRSLERRFKRLSSRLEHIDRLEEVKDELEPEDIEEMTEEERWAYEELLEGFSLATTKEELVWECKELERLIGLAKEAEKARSEVKLGELRRLLEDEGFFSSGTKLLVFTEHKDTLDYLVEQLRRWGFTVTQIHGGMKLGDEATPRTRIYAEREFRDPEGAQIMVATEAAGEGINLHYSCWVMVNYDIPWNPNRLEQRMGRIHRYGQTRDVLACNLVAADTREGEVLYTLLEKIEEIRQALGSDRVYDVVSEILPGARLDQLFRQALSRQISWEEFKERLAREVSSDKVNAIREATLEGLATRHIDLATLMAEDQKAKERRLVPEYIERFFLDAFQSFGGQVSRRQDGLLRIDRVPLPLQHVPPELRRRFGAVAKEYRKVAFRKEQLKQHTDAELMGPGHPLFESVVGKVLDEHTAHLGNGAIFYDADRYTASRVTFYYARVQDGRRQTVGGRLFALEVSQDGNISVANPSRLLDCKPAGEVPSALPDLSNTLVGDALLEWAYDHIFDPYLEEIRERRKRELNLSERHVRLSLDHLVSESISKLMRYRQRRDAGEDMAAALRQEETRKQELEERKEKRLREITLERNLTLTTPAVVGTALILPLPIKPGETSPRRDEEIERIAMEVAMACERQAGRRPEDVSQENLGFDIRSWGQDGSIRYIEVKGRAGIGAVWLTPNEWQIAQRFAQGYWLYIVVNATTDPQLKRIEDPVHTLRLVEEKEIVRYIVSVESWQEAAEAVTNRSEGGT